MAQIFELQTDALLLQLQELHQKQAIILRRLAGLRDLQSADDRIRGITRTPAEVPPFDNNSSDETTAEEAAAVHRRDESTRAAARDELQAAAAHREQQEAQRNPASRSTSPSASSPDPAPPEPQRVFRVGQRVRIKNPRRFQASTGTVLKITAGRIHVKTANGAVIQRSPDNVTHA